MIFPVWNAGHIKDAEKITASLHRLVSHRSWRQRLRTNVKPVMKQYQAKGKFERVGSMSVIMWLCVLRKNRLGERSEPTRVEDVSLATSLWTGSGRPFSNFSSMTTSSTITSSTIVSTDLEETRVVDIGERNYRRG